jgi:hypothetical protein
VTFVKVFIITISLWTGLKASSSASLANVIASSEINMQYYFFSIEKKAFLIKEKKDKTYALWYYTKKRKWQPVHNAAAFDGFPKATINLDDISVDKASEKVTFGSIVNDDVSGYTKDLLKITENKTVKIGWYFWVDKKAFLIKKKTNGEISVWHYTNDRKWQPVHNAAAFDGFPKAGKTLDNISFNPSSNTLSTGRVINENGIGVPPTPW